MEECCIQVIHSLADEGTHDGCTCSGISSGTLVTALVSYTNHITIWGRNLGADIGSCAMPGGIPLRTNEELEPAGLSGMGRGPQDIEARRATRWPQASLLAMV